MWKEKGPWLDLDKRTGGEVMARSAFGPSRTTQDESRVGLRLFAVAPADQSVRPRGRWSV